ncbi:hypothetical protein C8A03DRAFT_35133 [Achaetomium macrosporum]|uniref:Zn(2)-C6 fungal-type domain-containing protein n=1 Tax=Achaetomium macrosporum TaxID=79813 RepID=A0AAN7C7N3_9PEZI|nr:hypothetical protein C8A03DRAFT_35133 [Achaetomium macrosporum]
MVYCGKPSKGCQMCRTRRIKCDETKPTCNQCAKARRQCPGYKDEFDLVLRNENLAAKRRALKITTSRRSNAKRKKSKSSPSLSASSSSSSSSSGSLTATPASPGGATTTSTTSTSSSKTLSTQQRGHHQQQQATPFLAPTPIHILPEDLAPCHFVSNFVLSSRGDGRSGFLDYLIPLMQQAGERREMHLQHAFNACALASLGNRTSFLSPDLGSGPGRGAVGGGLGGLGEGARSCLGKAFVEYSRALRATQAALADPERWKSDGVLAAVLLLGMFENITATKLGNLAWGSHVEGAIQLVKARGRSQLKTKIGLQLWVSVRTHLIILTLSSGTAPAMGVDWWIQDAVMEPTAAECQRLSLKAGELRAEITRVFASAARTPENIRLVQDLMHRAQELDGQVAAWMRTVPPSWQPRTVCWQPHPPAVPGGGSDYSEAEVFPGRVDVYHDFPVAGVWNQARTTRLILMSLVVRCAAWVCSPVDYRTTPTYASAARVSVDMIADIIASVPYHLGWQTKRRELFPEHEPAAFACGEEYGLKGLAGYFLTWPLACVMTQDYTTDAQRAYTKGRLEYIGDALGIKYAHILSQLQVRVPSILIRSDGLLARPYPMAQNFEKLLSSARTVSPLSPVSGTSPLTQPEGMQQEQLQQNQRRPPGSSGDAAQSAMKEWVSV